MSGKPVLDAGDLPGRVDGALGHIGQQCVRQLSAAGPCNRAFDRGTDEGHTGAVVHTTPAGVCQAGGHQGVSPGGRASDQTGQAASAEYRAVAGSAGYFGSSDRGGRSRTGGGICISQANGICQIQINQVDHDILQARSWKSSKVDAKNGIALKWSNSVLSIWIQHSIGGDIQFQDIWS